MHTKVHIPVQYSVQKIRKNTSWFGHGYLSTYPRTIQCTEMHTKVHIPVQYSVQKIRKNTLVKIPVKLRPKKW